MPIPTDDGPISRVIDKPIPVAVVAPRPSLETPTTGRFWYDGLSTFITGLVYPLPPLTILNASVPPAPTVAVIFAPVPEPEVSLTATPTSPLYPDPNVKLEKYSLTVPPVSYVCGIVLVPTLTSNVLAEVIPVTGKMKSFVPSGKIVVVPAPLLQENSNPNK